MDISELDAFYFKFEQLWHSGLDIDTHAGQAWVGLCVHLGHAPGPLRHEEGNLPRRRNRDGPSRQRRRARRAEGIERKAEEAVGESDNAGNAIAEENVEDDISDVTPENEATVLVENAAENCGTETESEEFETELKTEVENNLEVNDEFCDDEKFYEEIAGKTAFSCLQCHLEYFPANYVPGNKIAKYCLCRWHLGVTRCKKCNKDLCGLGTIRVHRKTCLAPS